VQTKGWKRSGGTTDSETRSLYQCDEYLGKQQRRGGSIASARRAAREFVCEKRGEVREAKLEDVQEGRHPPQQKRNLTNREWRGKKKKAEEVLWKGTELRKPKTLRETAVVSHETHQRRRRDRYADD